MTPQQMKTKVLALAEARERTLAIRRYYVRYRDEFEKIITPLVQKHEEIEAEIAKAYEILEKAPEAIADCDKKLVNIDKKYKETKVDPKVQRLLKLEAEAAKLREQLSKD